MTVATKFSFLMLNSTLLVHCEQVNPFIPISAYSKLALQGFENSIVRLIKSNVTFKNTILIDVMFSKGVVIYFIAVLPKIKLKPKCKCMFFALYGINASNRLSFAI